jgi:hypothetical protein
MEQTSKETQVSNVQQETAEQAVARVLAAKDEGKKEQEAQWKALQDKVAKENEAKAQATAQAEQAKMDRLQAQRAASFEAEHRPAHLLRWLGTGGSVAEFENEWPEMLAKLRKDVTLGKQPSRDGQASPGYREL